MFFINIFSLIQNYTDIIIVIFSFIFAISFVIFYLDNLKLSSNLFIKFVQIISFIVILFFLIITICNTFDFQNIIFWAKDRPVDLHGHISISEEAGKHVGQGLSTIGSSLGLGATIVGVGSAVYKGIVKSSLPPLQKASIIVAGAVSAGFTHSIITTINRDKIHIKNTNSHIDSNINKFLDDSSSSPLQTLLFDIEGLNIVCLSLVILLIIQIIFKFYLKNSIKLNFSSILGTNINNSLEYYINKIINLNKKMNSIYD